jgi:hypothetical protein
MEKVMSEFLSFSLRQITNVGVSVATLFVLENDYSL